MKNIIRMRWLLLLLVIGALSACSGTQSGYSNGAQSTPTNTTSIGEVTSEDKKIEAFFQQVFDREVANDPEFQTTLGLKTDDQDKWFDYSDAAALETIQEAKRDLQILDKFDKSQLNDANKISLELMRYRLNSVIEEEDYIRHHYVVDQFRGQVTDKVSLLINSHSIDSLKDAQDYIARVGALGKVYTEMKNQLIDRADFGVITPAFAYPDMLNDIGGLLSGYPLDDSDQAHILLTDFKQKLDSSELGIEQRTKLQQALSKALEGPFNDGVRALVAEIRRQKDLVDGNKGVWSLPQGDRYYRQQIKVYTTLDLDADEIHQRGLADVERIHREMRELMKKVGFKGSLQDFFVFVRTDPSNFYSNDDAGREAFLADARQQTEEIFAVADQYFNILPKSKMEVRRVEPWRENSTSIAFYESPALDGSRPGYYYANLKDMTTYQKSVSTAITYHEGVPGHHFQIALSQEIKGLPDFRKHSFYGAYTEGWALYAERLAKDMGFYKDPMSDFGRLHDEIWRSARLVIDTGIHAKRWTREQAIDYFRQNTPLSEGDMVTEVERFFVWPGQALGYKIGMMKILELRQRAQKALGEKYDIREFHDVVIGKGAMPLPILESEINAYIARKKAA